MEIYKQNNIYGYNYIYFKVNDNGFVHYNSRYKQITCTQHSKYLMKNKVEMIDFMLSIQNAPFIKKIEFLHLYYALVHEYIRKQRNFKILFPIIQMMEECLEIPIESRWSIEKLKKEKERAKQV